MSNTQTQLDDNKNTQGLFSLLDAIDIAFDGDANGAWWGGLEDAAEQFIARHDLKLTASDAISQWMSQKSQLPYQSLGKEHIHQLARMIQSFVDGMAVESGEQWSWPLSHVSPLYHLQRLLGAETEWKQGHIVMEEFHRMQSIEKIEGVAKQLGQASAGSSVHTLWNVILLAFITASINGDRLAAFVEHLASKSGERFCVDRTAWDRVLSNCLNISLTINEAVSQSDHQKSGQTLADVVWAINIQWFAVSEMSFLDALPIHLAARVLYGGRTTSTSSLSEIIAIDDENVGTSHAFEPYSIVGLVPPQCCEYVSEWDKRLCGALSALMERGLTVLNSPNTKGYRINRLFSGDFIGWYAWKLLLPDGEMVTERFCVECEGTIPINSGSECESCEKPVCDGCVIQTEFGGYTYCPSCLVDLSPEDDLDD